MPQKVQCQLLQNSVPNQYKLRNFETVVTIVNMNQDYSSECRALSHHGTPANDDLLMHLFRCVILSQIVSLVQASPTISAFA